MYIEHVTLPSLFRRGVGGEVKPHQRIFVLPPTPKGENWPSLYLITIIEEKILIANKTLQLPNILFVTCSPFRGLGGSYATSAKIRSIRRKYSMPKTNKTRATMVPGQIHSHGMGRLRNAALKPSITPTIGLRM